MATTGAVGGSQIDVAGLVSQLVAAERARPDAQIARDANRITTQISALGQLMGSLSSFKGALTGLNTIDVFSTRAATSSDEKTMTATASSASVPGSYDIEVIQLAKAQQISSSPFAAGSAAIIGSGTLNVFLGANSFTVDIDPSKNTLADIRDAINSSVNNVGVRATIVSGTDGARLVLSSNVTGADNKITIAQSGGDGGLAQLAYSESDPGSFTVIKPAQDAVIRIAGAESTSSSNVITNVIDGLSLTLKAETTAESGPVTLNVGYDTSGVITKIKSFVTAFNALAAQINKLRSYDATTKTAGPMLGDSLLSGLERELRSVLSSNLADQPAGFQNLASIGITTQLDGTLGIDEGKLNKALSTNFEAVGKLFGSQDGVAAKLHKFAEARLASDGAIETRGKNLTEQQRLLQKRQDDLEVRMLAVQKAYTAQFTRLDTLLSQLQVTSSYLSQQISSLPKIGKD